MNHNGHIGKIRNLGRIAYVCTDPGVPVFGTKGCSIHVQEVIGELVSRGYRVDLFASRSGGSSPFPAESVEVHSIPCEASDGVESRERALMAAAGAVTELLQAHGPYDLVYERHSLWNAAAMEYAQRVGIPGILEVNAPLVEEQVSHRAMVHEVEARRIALASFETATSMIAVSAEVADYLRQCCPGHGGIHVIPNGVNPDRFRGISLPVDEVREPGCVGAESFTVGFVGTLKPWHGVEVLAESFQQLRHQVPEARLLIVGDGPERGRLEKQLAGELKAGACQFTGAVAPSGIPYWIGKMDVAVAPYPALDHFYFSPLKVYEYMAARRAVVASAIGQLRELIQPEINGLFCQPGNAASLTSQLIRLHRDQELRFKLGQGALKTILAQHTWQHAVDRILATVTQGVADPIGARITDAARS